MCAKEIGSVRQITIQQNEIISWMQKIHNKGKADERLTVLDLTKKIMKRGRRRTQFIDKS